MAFFKPKPPIDRSEFDWLIACFAWLRTVLDDRDFTPEFVLPGHSQIDAANTAQELFDAVRKLAGMEEWKCRLEKVEIDIETDQAGNESNAMTACGTFSVENGEAVIRYSDVMLKNPDALAATFAHELCHYLLMEAGDPPGGPDLMEHSTDLAAVYIGFGIYLANGARSFEAWNDGLAGAWQSSSTGYLSEAALATATAMFAHLHGYDLNEAGARLKPYLRKDLRKATKFLRHEYPDLSEAMGQVDLLDWHYD